MKFYIIFLACTFLNYVNAQNGALTTLAEWKTLDIDWLSVQQKEWYIQNNLYTPEYMIPMDFDIVQDKIQTKLFVTTLRFPGVPATLYTIVNNAEGKQVLRPYPDWSWYNHNNPCEGLISVHRVANEANRRLWVLDTGIFNSTHLCPAKLLAFDLTTDKAVASYTIPNNVALNKNKNGQLTNLVVEDESSTTGQITIYIADDVGNALIMALINVNTGTANFVRIENSIFNPVEEDSNFSIANKNFKIYSGLTGLAITPDHKFLLFRPLSSRSLYAFNTTELKIGGNIRFISASNVLSSQATLQAFSSKGTLYYGLTKELAIGCWSSFKDMNNPKNYKIAITDSRLQFVSGLKIFHHNGIEYIAVLTNRIQKIINQELNYNEINFRIMYAPVSQFSAICD